MIWQRMRAVSWASVARVVNRNAIWLVLLLAWFLAVYHLDARTWHGDELNSVAESISVGLNPNGLLYFLPMHVWMQGGTSEFWQRLPSVWFAVLSVALAYKLARALALEIALPLALLFATSPFLLEYAQQVRFYTFFLFASLLVYWSLHRWLARPLQRNLWSLVVANLFGLGAHFFVILVWMVELLTVLLSAPRLKQTAKFGILVALALAGMAFLWIEPVRRAGFYIVSVLTNPYGSPYYTGSRGLSVAHFAKIPFTAFFFSFGERVYPLDLPIVIPGMTVFGVALILGISYWWKKRGIGAALLVSLLVVPPLTYLVFDPLASSTLQGAAPRYLIFLLPLFYLLVAGGTGFRQTRWLIVPLLLVNFASLGSYWAGTWAYTDDLVDWRALTQVVTQEFTPDTQIFLDGRATGNAQFYFPPDARSALTPQTARVQPETTRAIVIASDFHAESRQTGNMLLRELQKNFTFERSWSKYPAFVQILSQQHKPPNTFSVDAATGRIELPVELYGLEFQDVRLPVQAKFNGQSLPLFGAFAVAPNAPRVLPLSRPTAAQTLWMLSSMIGSPKSVVGDAVAELVVEFDDGRQQIIPLRNGYETGRWDGACESCETAFQWHKRLALLGAAAYPGSWNDFQASVFAAPLELKSSQRVTKITLKGLRPDETLYVWGLFLK